MGFWAAAIPALIGAAGSAFAAKSANKGGTRSSREPFEERSVRTPYGPTQQNLTELPFLLRNIFERRRNTKAPPRISSSGIRGASPHLQELAAAMRERAMNSDFIPNAQKYATSRLGKANPMMQSVFDKAMDYKSPALEMLQRRAQGGDFSRQSPAMSGFLNNLLGGQRSLGEEGFSNPMVNNPMSRFRGTGMGMGGMGMGGPSQASQGLLPQGQPRMPGMPSQASQGLPPQMQMPAQQPLPPMPGL